MDFDVDVVVLVYNQERTVGIALDSILRQQTSLNFRILLFDDCSSDRSNDICLWYAEKYPNVIYTRNSTNLGVVRNYIKAFASCNAANISILEGDDYWIDDYKLESQAAILRVNPDIGLVFSDYLILRDHDLKLFETSLLLRVYSKATLKHLFPSLLRRNHICPATTMFRRKLLDDIDFEFMISRKYLTIDYHLWLHISKTYRAFYHSSPTAVYRVSSNSVSNTSNLSGRMKFATTRINTVLYFTRDAPFDKSLDCVCEEVKLLDAIRCFNLHSSKQNLTKLINIFQIRPLLMLLFSVLLFKSSRRVRY